MPHASTSCQCSDCAPLPTSKWRKKSADHFFFQNFFTGPKSRCTTRNAHLLFGVDNRNRNNVCSCYCVCTSVRMCVQTAKFEDDEFLRERRISLGVVLRRVRAFGLSWQYEYTNLSSCWKYQWSAVGDPTSLTSWRKANMDTEYRRLSQISIDPN